MNYWIVIIIIIIIIINGHNMDPWLNYFSLSLSLS